MIKSTPSANTPVKHNWLETNKSTKSLLSDAIEPARARCGWIDWNSRCFHAKPTPTHASMDKLTPLPNQSREEGLKPTKKDKATRDKSKNNAMQQETNRRTQVQSQPETKNNTPDERVAANCSCCQDKAFHFKKQRLARCFAGSKIWRASMTAEAGKDA